MGLHSSNEVFIYYIYIYIYPIHEFIQSHIYISLYMFIYLEYMVVDIRNYVDDYFYESLACTKSSK